MSRAEREHPAYKYGTDADFRDWLSLQSSCLDGAFTAWIDGQGRNVAAHVRRAGIAGIAFKPPFSAVPLTDQQHRIQHQHGELEAIKRFAYWSPKPTTNEEAKAWFDQQAKIYLQRWITEKTS